MAGFTETEHLLLWAWAYCDHHDKSTGFMFQFMEDTSKTDYDTVLDFIEVTPYSKRKHWYDKNPNWLNENP